MAQTGYYSSWASYKQVSVTVNADPQCTVSVSPNTIAGGGSATLSYASSNASSFSINNGVGSKTANTSGQIAVSPSQTTTYTGMVVAGNAQNTCSATLFVSCQESWSCSGKDIVQTNPDCSTTDLATCVSPAFCQSGSSSCQYPATSFNPSGRQTGQLQVVPNLVRPDETVQVYWNVSGAQSCTVIGTNGDSWTGLSSPSGGEASKPIISQVTYTLFCNAYGTNPNISQSQTVKIAPTYQEM